MRNIFIILSIVVGCLMIGGGQYIDKKIASGQMQLESAERKVDSIEKFSSLIPMTKPLGEKVGDAAAPKIASANEMIAHYSSIAKNLKLFSLVFFILAAYLIFLKFRKNK
jgi:hypothetical protein